MAKKRNDFSLGLWVIAIALLLVATVVFIGGSTWGRTYRSYTVRFPVTYALPDEIKSGAQIYCGGAVVGLVRRAELRMVERDGQPSSLYVYLEAGISEVVELRSDCAIVARGPLLGGGGNLVIKDPGRNGEVLEDGAVIDGASGGSINQALDTINAELNPRNPVGLLATIKSQLDAADADSIIAKVHRSLTDLNAVTRSVSQQVDPAQAQALMSKLHVLLDNLNATTGELRAQLRSGAEGTLLAKVHAALDTANDGLQQIAHLMSAERASVHQTLESVRRTAELIEEDIAKPIASELNRANARSLLNQIRSSFDKINASLVDLQVVTGRTRTLVTLNEDRVNRLMMDVSETASHLKSASKDLRRNPWRLFYRPSLEETKQLNIFDAAREFSEAAARLDDSAAQLAALMESQVGAVPVNDDQLGRIRKRLQQTFEDYVRAEQARWKQLDLP